MTPPSSEEIAPNVMGELDWPGERCKNCGRRNPIGFSVSDETWRDVMGDCQDVMCPACFDQRAQLASVKYSFGPTFPVSWSDWNDEPRICGACGEYRYDCTCELPEKPHGE